MNIYAGNLPWGLSEEDLREAFEAFGEVVSVKIIQDKFTGRSRGFGFVEMPNQGEGEAAISALNGKDLKGREIVVNQARPRRDDQGGGGGGGF
jgi:RNA recognition motif-containing protein